MEAKRQRTTNRSQFSAMVENMKKHPDIANNMTKKSPDVVLQFWDSLAAELNNLEPPCKGVAEWKKVWSDYKSGIKRKLAHNKREQNGTGGGQNTQMFFSVLEEEVIELTSMHTIVGGIPNVASYGVPTRATNDIFSTLDDVPSTSRAVDHSMSVDIEVEETQEVEGPGDDNHQRRNREPKQISLLQKQIQINEEHVKKFEKLTEETNGSLKKISKTLDKLHEDSKTSNELFRGFMADMKSHFTFMQKLAVQKNAIKQQMLDIELEKLRISCREEL